MMDKLIAILERHEEVVLHVYRDNLGYLTIGCGRLVDRAKGGGITAEESRYLLNNDIARVKKELTRLPWFKDLDEVRQVVLIDMCFNLGFAGLCKFKRFLACVSIGDWKGAVSEMWDSKWAFQVGDGPGNIEDRVDRLTKMMISGQWPTDI